ncbi:MAG: AAA family ATPase [Pseudonocardiales bacterium]|nr:AAA family ATPase [Pseudonocardiales bacterium]
MNRSGEVLIVTGPPGAGKTTVAALLASGNTGPAAHLRADDFWHYIKTGWIAPYLPEAHQQNTVVLRVLAAASFEYAMGGYLVVVDGIVGPWFLPPFTAQALASSVPLSYVVLRPSLATTLCRAQQRATPSLTGAAPITSLYEQLNDLGAELHGHVLDNTDSTPEQTAEQICGLFRSGALRLEPSTAR